MTTFERRPSGLTSEPRPNQHLGPGDMRGWNLLVFELDPFRLVSQDLESARFMFRIRFLSFRKGRFKQCHFHLLKVNA